MTADSLELLKALIISASLCYSLDITLLLQMRNHRFFSKE